MDKELFRSKLAEVVFAPEGGLVWLEATTQIKDRLTSSYSKEELQIMAEELAAAEDRWEASRLKNKAVKLQIMKEELKSIPTIRLSNRSVTILLIATNYFTYLGFKMIANAI